MREPFDVIFLRTCLVSAFVVPTCFLVCQLCRLKRVNYQGNTVPSSMGVGFLIVWVSSCFIYYPYDDRAVFAWYSSLLQMDRLGSTLFIFLVGFGILGLIDDFWGTRATGGLRGHFLELLSHRRVTTGSLKAIGGIAVAFAGAYLWAVRMWLRTGYIGLHNPTVISGAVLSGMLVALSANTGNLLDVRPSRSLKGLSVLVAVTWLLSHRMPGVWLHFQALCFVTLDLPIFYVMKSLLIPVVLYAPLDFRSKAMMGDVGSNALGALAGWYAMVTLSLPGQAILVALLLAFHLWTEKHSLTEFLARHPVLDWLDRVGTNRPKAEGG